MYRHGLRVSSFYIKRKYARSGSVLPLNKEISCKDLDEREFSEKNVFTIIEAFIKYYADFEDNEGQMRMFTIAQESILRRTTKNYTCLFFTVRCGTYGLESDIVNRVDREVRYRRKREDADIKQFSCLFFVPKDTPGREVKKGIIIFQEFGPYGVKTFTLDRLEKFFSNNYNITFETRSISPASYVKKILHESKVQRVTYILNDVSTDNADNLIMNAGREERSFITPVLKQGGIDGLFHSIGYADDETMVEICDEVVDERIFEQYSDIKFNVTLGKRRKTISLFDISQFGIIEEVPDDILMNNGQPEKNLLFDLMITTALKFKEKLVLTSVNL